MVVVSLFVAAAGALVVGGVGAAGVGGVVVGGGEADAGGGGLGVGAVGVEGDAEVLGGCWRWGEVGLLLVGLWRLLRMLLGWWREVGGLLLLLWLLLRWRRIGLWRASLELVLRWV